MTPDSKMTPETTITFDEWRWRADWCKDRGVSPFLAVNWNTAGAEYIKACGKPKNSRREPIEP